MEILFGQYLGVLDVEEAIKTKIVPKNSQVSLDLSSTRYMDLYAVEIILVYSIFLKNENQCQVRVLAPGYIDEFEWDPQAEGILAFLANWRFFEVLEDHGIKVCAPDIKRGIKGRTNEFSSKSLPLTFFAEENIDQIIKNYSFDTSLLDIVGASAKVNWIGKAGIKGIIISELCKNAIEHGQSSNAHIMVGVKKGESESKLKDKEFIKRRDFRLPAFFIDFYAKLKSSDCLEIIVSDTGPGIVSTLRSAYNKDKIISKPKKATHANIIKYAFELHSTSKKKGVLENESGKSNPRGLYFVKNLVRRNKGLLICRSVNSIICYDFLSSETGKYYESKVDKRLKTIKNVPGTQVYILIPLDRSQSGYSIKSIPESVRQFEVSENSIAWIDIAGAHKNSIFNVSSALQEITKTALAVKKSTAIVVDFGRTNLSKDELFPIAHLLFTLGLDNYKFIAINAEQYIVAIDEMFIDDTDNRYYVVKQRPFIILNRESYPYVYLIAGKYFNTKFDLNLMVTCGIENCNIIDIPEIADHWFVAKDSKVHFCLNMSVITKKIVEFEQRRFISCVEDIDYGIKHEGKFLLPTQAYTERFYQVSSIYKDNCLSKIATRWLFEKIYENSEQKIRVLSISKIGKAIGDSLHQLYSKLDLNILHINSINPTIQPNMLRDFDDDRDIVVLVDVIATSKSLLRVVKSLESRNVSHKVKGIFSIIDLREGEGRGLLVTDKSQYTVHSLHNAPVRMHKEDKPNSWSWNEVVRIDNDEWIPIQSQKYNKDLITFDDFVKTYVVTSKSMRIGHFEMPKNNNHFTYFFLTLQMAAMYGETIANEIYKDVSELVLSHKDQPKVSKIIHHKNLHGLDDIVSNLSNYIGADICKIDPKFTISSDIIPENSTVLILDPAISSGETIWDLLYAVSLCKPKTIYVYVVVNRAPLGIARQLWNTEKYNGTETVFRNYAYIPVPAYKGHNCPQCLRLQRLNRQLASSRYNSIRTELEQKKNDLAILPIDFKISSVAISYNDMLLAQIIRTRVLIQKSLEGIDGAWPELMKIVSLSKPGSDAIQSLLIILYYEGEAFHTNTAVFTGQFRRYLIKILLHCIKNDLYGYMSIKILVLYCSTEFANNFDNIIQAILPNKERLMDLITELVVYKDIVSSQYEDFLRRIKSTVEYDITHNKNYKDYPKIVHALTQIYRTHKIESNTKTGNNYSVFKRIYNILFSPIQFFHHDYLTTYYKFIHGLNLSTYMVMLDKHYFAPGSVREKFHYDLTPVLRGMGRIFDELCFEYPYFENEFEFDLDALDRALTQLYYEDVPSLQHFDDIFRDEKVQTAKSRLRERVVDSKSSLRLFFMSRVFDILDVSKEIISSFEDEFRHKDILINDLSEFYSFGKVFFNEKCFISLLSGLLSNTVLHAFKHCKSDNSQCHSIDLHFDHDSTFVYMNYQDNGVGIKEETDNYISRFELDLQSYEGVLAEYALNDGVFLRIGFKKWEA